MKLKNKSSNVICCLIPKDDFAKAILLTNIAREEGAAFAEIRVPFNQCNINDLDLTDLKIETILSIDPLEYSEKSYNGIIEQLKEMIKLQPNYIEFNSKLEVEVIKNLSSKAEEKGARVIIAKYLDEFPSKKELYQHFKKLQILKPDIIKIVAPAENEFDSNKILQLYRNSNESKLVALCSGESGKLSQLLAPVFGAKFTYGYISRKSIEAQFPINLLRQNLELLFQTLK